MPLQELKRLTQELEELSLLLKKETQTRARWVIMRRIHEILQVIDLEGASR